MIEKKINQKKMGDTSIFFVLILQRVIVTLFTFSVLKCAHLTYARVGTGEITRISPG